MSEEVPNAAQPDSSASNKKEPWKQSDLAPKYREPKHARNHPILHQHRIKKSGLTPLETWREGQDAPSTQEMAQRRRLEIYQRVRLRGFTAKELQILETLAAYVEAKPSTLANPIHPLLQKGQWQSADNIPKHLALFDIGDGMGLFEANNPVVWEALVPSLQFATRIITNAHCWLWWDALLFGDYKALNFPPFTNSDDYPASFWRRSPEIASDEREQTQLKFLEYCKFIKLGICNNVTEAGNGMPITEDDPDDGDTIASYGLTYIDPWRVRSNVLIDIRMIKKLMRNDLTPAERLVEQFFLATTLVHELTHAVFGVTRCLKPSIFSVQIEPYFEDEPKDEVGYSWEKATFHAVCEAIAEPVDAGLEALAMGFWAREWPKLHDYQSSGEYCRNGTAITPDLEYIDRYPIQIKHIEMLFNEEFWRLCVGIYGKEPLHHSSQGEGRREWQLQETPSFQSSPPAAWHEDENVHLGETRDQQFLIRTRNYNNYHGRMIRAALAANWKNETKLREMQAQQQSDAETTGKTAAVKGPYHDLFELDDPCDDSGDENELPQDPDPLPEPFRYHEIRQFLLDNRIILALDKGNGIYPENTLRTYCNRLQNSISITPDQFRQFAKYSTQSDWYIMWHAGGAGWVEWYDPDFDDQSWPLLPEPELPTRELMQEFLDFTPSVGRLLPMRYFQDIDMEMVREAFENEYGSPVSQAEFWALITRCENVQALWRFGAPGVIKYFPEEP